MGRPFRAFFSLSAIPGRCPGLAWFAPLVLESSRTPTVHEHATKAMKPAATQVPMSVKVGFIALQVAVLALHASCTFIKSVPHEHDALLAADFWLAFTLVASTVVFYFRAPRLADFGVVVIILWILINYLGPGYP